MEIVNYLINFGDKEFEQIQDPTTGYVNSVNVATYIIGEILNDEMEFNNLLYKSIFDDYCHHLEEDKKIDTAYFLNSPDEKVRDLAVQLTIPKHNLSELWKRRGVECKTPEDTFRTDIPKTINSYKLKIITQATKDTIERLKTVSPDELMSTMAQLKQLKSVEKELSKSLKRTIIV